MDVLTSLGWAHPVFQEGHALQPELHECEKPLLFATLDAQLSVNIKFMSSSPGAMGI